MAFLRLCYINDLKPHLFRFDPFEIHLKFPQMQIKGVSGHLCNKAKMQALGMF